MYRVLVLTKLPAWIRNGTLKFVVFSFKFRSKCTFWNIFATGKDKVFAKCKKYKRYLKTSVEKKIIKKKRVEIFQNLDPAGGGQHNNFFFF